MAARLPRWVFVERSFWDTAFIVPLRPTRSSVISPSDRVTMPARRIRLNAAAPSSWLRLIRPQRLAKRHVELLGLNIGHEFLNAGMDQGSAGDGTVGITLRYRPALAGGVFPALAQLILDGSVALVIGRIAGIVPSRCVLRGLGPIVKDPASWPTGRNRPAYGRSISAIISGSVATALDNVTVLYHRPRKWRVSSSYRSIHPIQRSSPFHGSCGVWQEESFEHAQLRNVSTRQIEKVCSSEARPGLAQSAIPRR